MAPKNLRCVQCGALDKQSFSLSSDSAAWYRDRLRKETGKEITEDDRICPKCRQRLYRKKKKEEDAANLALQQAEIQKLSYQREGKPLSGLMPLFESQDSYPGNLTKITYKIVF